MIIGLKVCLVYKLTYIEYYNIKDQIIHIVIILTQANNRPTYYHFVLF